jgi:hypothetical protein
VIGADDFIDSALDCLERDEPSLAAWLETNQELNKAISVSMQAMYKVLLSDALAGKTVQQSMPRLNALVKRIVCAAAFNAAVNERPSIQQEFNFGSK